MDILNKFLLLLLFPSICFAQTVGVGVTPTHICYSDEQGNVVNHQFDTPNIISDFGPVQPIDSSPFGSDREIEDIPNYPLAAFHHWVFSTVLFRAQRQYSDCVGRIKQSQRLLGISPLIDEPGSGIDAIINSVREYEVPFRAININYPWRPADLTDGIAHSLAAIAGVNITVLHISLCTQSADYYESVVRGRLR